MTDKTVKIQVNARNRAYHFEGTSVDKVLNLGLSSGVALPYECGSGTCGTCKARLISGELNDQWPEAPGHKYLKSKKSEFLMCQCTAETDIVIEVESFVQTMEAGDCVPAALHGRIHTATLLTPDVMFLRIELDQSVDFDAGQFMLVQFPAIEGFRGWSMVNYQRHTKTLEFVVKRKPGGALSDWLFNNNCEGVEVELYGPLGNATFYSSLAKNILCIAGGSGIAGIMSILSRALQDGYFTQYKGYIFFGVRTMKDTFFLDELAAIRTECGDNLNVIIALSEEDASSSMQSDYKQLIFDRGYVHEVAGRHMEGHYQNIRAYLAGPPPVVNGSIGMLLRARVTTDNIRYDKFS
ncbi:MAG: 2Fe-2S iron-sulfur cluster-binding protein [Candidatus Thiodiazotropha sp.]